MGKLRERRKKERKRKFILQTCVTSAITLVVVIVSLSFLSNLKPSQTDAPLANDQPSDPIPNRNEEVQESQKTEPQTLQIMMIGDMLMHDGVLESAEQVDKSYNFDHIFANVKETISSADLAIVNQETIMAGPAYGYTGYPSFNTPFELTQAEVNAGFDVLLFATNHALDKGVKGVTNCIEYLDTNHPTLGYVGINRNQEQRDTIYTYEANGITVAILNYTYGHNGVKLPSDRKYLINELKEDKVRDDIRKAEEIADFTIVCPHWGTELTFETDEKQKEWAQLFLEEGVDLVLGAHPHVIQPIEWMSDENGNQMLIYYSLGNFVNGTNSTGHGVTNRMVGGIADVTILRDEETGKVEIARYGAIPVVCHIDDGTDYTVYLLENYTEELASENQARGLDAEFSKSLCESIVSQVWGE